jgi:hypothetical protein
MHDTLGAVYSIVHHRVRNQFEGDCVFPDAQVSRSRWRWMRATSRCSTCTWWWSTTASMTTMLSGAPAAKPACLGQQHLLHSLQSSAEAARQASAPVCTTSAALQARLLMVRQGGLSQALRDVAQALAARGAAARPAAARRPDALAGRRRVGHRAVRGAPLRCCTPLAPAPKAHEPHQQPLQLAGRVCRICCVPPHSRVKQLCTAVAQIPSKPAMARNS